MRRKNRIPIPEPTDWHLESQLINNDPPKVKPINHTEESLYEATLKAGGLLKERWVWRSGTPTFAGYVLPGEK